jgi:hypothetical protein
VVLYSDESLYVGFDRNRSRPWWGISWMRVIRMGWDVVFFDTEERGNGTNLGGNWMMGGSMNMMHVSKLGWAGEEVGVSGDEGLRATKLDPKSMR